MLTDTLVLLLCTAATAGENGKFPSFNPIYICHWTGGSRSGFNPISPGTGGSRSGFNPIYIFHWTGGSRSGFNPIYMPLDRW